MPETDRFGVMMLERRIAEALHKLDEASAERRPPLALSVGSATFPRDGQDFDELLQRCRQRMDASRHTLRRRLQLQDLDFWQSLSALLGPWPARIEAAASGEPPRGGSVGRAVGTATGGSVAASYRGPLPDDHFAQVQREVGRELAREPSARGLVYLGSAEAVPGLPLLPFLPIDLRARVGIVLRQGQPPPDHPAVSSAYAPLPAAAPQFDFLLYLSEASAYAYARRRGDPFGFHSSDRPLVDHLIARLQQAYDPQPY